LDQVTAARTIATHFLNEKKGAETEAEDKDRLVAKKVLDALAYTPDQLELLQLRKENESLKELVLQMNKKCDEKN
jgi:hypothetical protein